MVSVNDILQIILKSRVEGYSDVYLNIFHYKVHGLTTPFELNGIDGINFTELWFDYVIAPFLPGFSALMGFVGYDVTDYETLEFYNHDFPTPITGNTGGEVLNPFYALGIALNRATRATRNGSKRFTGQAEVNFTNGLPSPAYLTFLEPIVPLLAQTVVLEYDDNFLTLQPVIVRKSGAFTYGAVNPIASASISGSTTQNSRKPGRGS